MKGWGWLAAAGHLQRAIVGATNSSSNLAQGDKKEDKREEERGLSLRICQELILQGIHF